MTIKGSLQVSIVIAKAFSNWNFYRAAWNADAV